ncbi:MAG TPA: PspC domain-containing protein [Ornithinibacter sp.]|nr:PspC domain-containing protein [Ornithinibacter sp.]
MSTPYEPAAAHPRTVTDNGPDAGYAGPAGPGYPYPGTDRPQRPPLVRSRTRGWTPGVCAAVAAHLGVSRRTVRWAFVLLTLAGGAGLAAYLFLWALTPEGEATADQLSPPGSETAPERRQWGAVLAVGGVLVVLGVVLLTPVLGGSVIGSVLVPLFTIAVGAIVAWSNLDDAQRSRWLGSGAGRYGWMRVALGAGLTVAGILVLVTRGESFTAVWDALLAAVSVLVGVLIVAAPWALRLWGDLRREQVAAARATERADIAAHLHDSVLQTLALIQRQSHDAAAVTRLARAQERELRSWLYAEGPQGSQSTLAAAVTEVAHDVEDLQGVPIDLVVTGDRAYEPHGAALVQAMREALLNAVRHGGTPVTAYVEIGPAGVEAFVRDRGDGFDLEAVPADRLGVRQSILGRMERHGGTARVRRRDDGTEVELRLPPIEGGAS